MLGDDEADPQDGDLCSVARGFRFSSGAIEVKNVDDKLLTIAWVSGWIIAAGAIIGLSIALLW